MDLTPHNIKNKKVRRCIRAFVRNIDSVAGESEESIESVRAAHISQLARLSSRETIAAEAAINVFADLAKMGWTFTLSTSAVDGKAPSTDGTEDVRVTRRRQLSARRHEQLRQTTSRDFIERMESGHVFGGQVVSIFNVMRDGRDLANWLTTREEKRDSDAFIKPYVQFVGRNEMCKHTGFSLQDIWRYFRHTWASAYESVPGRSFLLLVRDAAAPFHPVMGIAALASAASVLPARDEKFIGWSGEEFARHCAEKPSNDIARWVKETVQRSIKETYRTDFIAQGILPLRIARKDIPALVGRLRRTAAAAKERHIRQTEAREHKSVRLTGGGTDEEWEGQARTDLFRSKRATELASLIEIQGVIDAAYQQRRGKDRLRALCSTDAGRNALKKIVRIARSRAIGTAIADLVVCGAVPPYNELLGGKLVAMLAASPEVVRHYKRRYVGAPSVIASSMAGRRIVRRANLVYIGTTSLYGTRPSQYDRIKVPAERVGGRVGHYISYRYLGETAGLGSTQFGYATKKALDTFLRKSHNGFRRVNNVFGEGANPKWRALRDGIASLGFSEDLMIHGLTKSVYGVSLIENLREYLLGIQKRPKYFFPLNSGRRATEEIANWWYERWVVVRSQRTDVVGRLTRHSLVRPIVHGARVLLPSAEMS